MGDTRAMDRHVAALALAATLLVSCASGATTTAASPTAPASATASAIVLHWMSFSRHSEPRYQLLYEGGEGTPFTELRLLGPDGAFMSTAPATASATEPMRLCLSGRSGPTTYGPLRATLILSTQDMLGDVIRRPDAYRVEVRVNSAWVGASLVNVCHGQE